MRTVDSWKRKLLDLTKRNRALNFRVNKVSTVTIVDEQPAEVFRQLYVHEHSMKFKAVPQSDTAESSMGSLARMDDEDVDHRQSEDDENVPEAQDFAPYDRTSLGERYPDEWLQTASAPEALVEMHGPLHESDLLARVASFWNTRAGHRIQHRLRGTCVVAERGNDSATRGVLLAGVGCVRSSIPYVDTDTRGENCARGVSGCGHGRTPRSLRLLEISVDRRGMGCAGIQQDRSGVGKVSR
ncbi:MAG: DUF3320 domain-containing protein [Gemmatimonadaceae bacterium]